MKKNLLKFLCIIFISIICFCMFRNGVKATVTCEVKRKSDYEVDFKIEESEKGSTFAGLKIDPKTNKVLTLYVCDEEIIKNGENVSKYDLSKKRSFRCNDINVNVDETVNFGSVDMTKKFYKFTDTIKCGVEYGIQITGLVNAPDDATDESIMCSGAGYNFIIRQGQDNQTQCNVTIEQKTKDGDVIMKHGGLTTINPSAGKYICETPEGDKIEFSLSKNLSKGSLKSTSDCPSLGMVSGGDGTQEQIQDPIVGPSEEPDGPSDLGTDSASQLENPKWNKKKLTKITVKNIFNVGNGTITCEGALGEAMPILRDIFKYIRIGAVVLFIGLTSFDYVKAIASSDQTLFKKSNERVLKRVIGLVVIILLPSLVNLILAIVQIRNGNCGIS